MIVFRRLEDARPGPHRRAVAIGSFDGVHRGHQAVLTALLAAAGRQGLEPLVLTFEPTPRQYFARSAVSRLRLTPDGERLDLLAAHDVRATVVLPFDERLRGISAEDFCRDLLWAGLGARHVVMGEGHTIGRGAAGTLARVRELGKELGFTVEAVPAVRLNGDALSSSAVRQALVHGDARRATALLGRRYALRGQVVEGRHQGRELGLPTANLRLPSQKLLPAVGIYAAFASGLAVGAARPAAVNIGPAPTFDVEELIVEAHLPGFSGSLYGQPLSVHLEERLREVLRFESAEELRQQVSRDVERTLAICAATQR